MPAPLLDVRALDARLRRTPLAFALAFLALNGVRGADFPQFRWLTAHPLALIPEAGGQFRHGSPFTFFLGAPLAQLFGPHAAWALVTAGGLVLLALALRRFLGRFPSAQAETVWLVLASTPLCAVLTRWLGKSDPYLIAFYLWLAAGPRRPLARAALAAAMVLCHREMATVMLAVHLFYARRDAAPVLCGLAAGHALILVYWHLLLPAPPFSRARFAALRAPEILGGFARNPLVHVAAALGWFWRHYAAQLRRWRDLAPLVLVIAVAAWTMDFTRVATLCALPIVLHVAARVPAAAPRAAWPLLYLLQPQIEDGGVVWGWSWLR
jgi:hypothetical protein